jgi:hypothetical protein
MAKKEEVKKWMQVIVDKLNEVGPIVAEEWAVSAVCHFRFKNWLAGENGYGWHGGKL